MSSHLLIEESPLVVLPSLAALIGLNEAIAVQQIHWICRVKAEHEDYRTFRDGEMWCCYSIEQWLKKMPWLSDRTCRRMLKGLEERKILFATKPNAKEWNHTKWYRIDYSSLDKIGKSNDQNCQNESVKMTGSIRTKRPDQDPDKMTGSSIKEILKRDPKKMGESEKNEPATQDTTLVVNSQDSGATPEIKEEYVPPQGVATTAKRTRDLGGLRGERVSHREIAAEHISAFASPAEKEGFKEWAKTELQKNYPQMQAFEKAGWSTRNIDANNTDDVMAFELLKRYRESLTKAQLQGQESSPTSLYEDLVGEHKKDPSILSLSHGEFKERFGVSLYKFCEYLEKND